MDKDTEIMMNRQALRAFGVDEEELPEVERLIKQARDGGFKAGIKKMAELALDYENLLCDEFGAKYGLDPKKGWTLLEIIQSQTKGMGIMSKIECGNCYYSDCDGRPNGRDLCYRPPD